MPPLRIASIAVLAGLIILGLFILTKNRHQRSNLYFSLLTFSAALWVGTNLIVDLSGDRGALGPALFWAQVSIIGPTLVTLFFLYFSQNFPRQTKKRGVIFYLFTALPALFIASLAPTSFSISEVRLVEGVVEATPGRLYDLFTIYFICYVLWGIWNVIRSHHTTKSPLERMQINYLLGGIVLTMALGTVTNLIFLRQGQTEYASLGPLSTAIFIGSTAYAIIRHRLMDIRLVVARSVAYSLLLLIMGTLYTGGLFTLQSLFFRGGVGIAQVISSSLLALLVALTFQPLRRVLERVTDGVFFRDRYDPDLLLRELGRIASSTIILDRLARRTLMVLGGALRSEGGAIIVRDRETKLLIENDSLLDQRLLFSDVESLFHHRKPLIFDDLPEGRIKAQLRGLGVAVAVPLESRQGVIGLILLGGKKSGDPYSGQDLRILAVIGPELSVAIENARAYHQIERFNETLRLRIERATRKLREANSHLEELDRAKDEFISLASHQLRTPLTAIKGYVSMVQEGDVGKLTGKQQDFLSEAAGGAERMASLIDDLLNASRMDAGRFMLDRTPTNLEEIVSEEIGELSHHAEAHQLELIYHEPTSRQPLLVIDKTKTRQVIINFIDNAIYYTPEGKVEVFLERVGDSIEFRVTDTGIGISPEDQRKLFVKFYRAPNAKLTRPDGTGLGLYLAKRVIEDQGGEILFHSELGRGSTFGFRLPLPKIPRRPIHRVMTPADARRHTHA